MLFPTITFAIFFMVVLPVSWLLMPRGRRWKIFMVAASYYFYGYWNWRFVFLIAASTIGNHFFAVAISRHDGPRRRRRLLTLAVIANLGVLGYFKYYDFFVSQATNVAHRLGIPISPEIVSVTLPIGISFFTFQALSYVIDVYRGTVRPARLADFAVYLSFFPHVVAGPIVRASEFLPQLKERHDPRRVDASRAFFLIFIGLFKKVVIANVLASQIVDASFASPKQQSGLTLLVAIYGYAIQIYADFSGYTDMAIGIALLLGFRFPQNFDRPYAATSLQDFWRRWHMTLSRWLRDYLYIPLGGNRGPRWRTSVNLMLTFVLGGLWHGAAWTFVVWGALHGAFLSVGHWRRDRRTRLGRPEPADTRTRRFGARVLTFHLVCIAWVFFRAESLSNVGELFGRLLQPSHFFGAAPLVSIGVLLAIAAGLLEQYVPHHAMSRVMAAFSRRTPVVQGAILGLVLLVTNTLGPRGIAPFIYYRF
jgi:D-alanyl-lipoteichoic acid acyltransferase DltB (MBOAT superfamily)